MPMDLVIEDREGGGLTKSEVESAKASLEQVSSFFACSNHTRNYVKKDKYKKRNLLTNETCHFSNKVHKCSAN